MSDSGETRVRVARFDPATDEKPHIQEYRIPYLPGSSVMDALYHIYEHLDGTLAFRGSCMNGWCSVCMIRVNGKAVMPCQTAMERDLLLEPVRLRPVLRDLVVDREGERGAVETMPGDRCACGSQHNT